MRASSKYILFSYWRKTSLNWLFQIFCLIIILFIYQVNLCAEIRYVSKTGTSIPPYTSWETASDSIQKCIDISSFGDTIYVGNGVYKEKSVMIPGLSLIGMGNDSTVIDMIALSPTEPHAIEMRDSCLVENFKFIFAYNVSPSGIAIFMGGTTKGCIVQNNHIVWADQAIWITEGTIKHNFLEKTLFGIVCAVNDPSHQYKAYIDSNYISFSFIGVQGLSSTISYVTNNIFRIDSPHSSDGRVLSNWINCPTPVFSNNLIAKPVNDILFAWGIKTSYPGDFTNNVFLSRFENIFNTYASTIKNNVIVGSKNIVNGSSSDVRYNNFWKVETYPADSTNLSVDPMFVNDSTDFHLQMYSKMIDAGDPNILDKDGSRSDMGLYGGPNGISYPYQDLPPRIPVNFTAELDSPLISFKWNTNTESDFKSYRLYRDTIPDFNISQMNMVAEIKDTFFIDNYPPDVNGLYYKLTSVDKQLNESEPTEEIILLVNDIKEDQLIMADYILYQNYPNPFNPSTKIGYRLAKKGYVKLYIYDITGSIVKTLVNEEKEAGYYEVEFTAGDIASGLYIYNININDSEKRIPVFVKTGKMLLVK